MVVTTLLMTIGFFWNVLLIGLTLFVVQLPGKHPKRILFCSLGAGSFMASILPLRAAFIGASVSLSPSYTNLSICLSSDFTYSTIGLEYWGAIAHGASVGQAPTLIWQIFFDKNPLFLCEYRKSHLLT